MNIIRSDISLLTFLILGVSLEYTVTTCDGFGLVLTKPTSPTLISLSALQRTRFSLLEFEKAVSSRSTTSTRSGLLQSSRFLLIRNSASKNGNDATGAATSSPTNDDDNESKEEGIEIQEIVPDNIATGRNESITESSSSDVDTTKSPIPSDGDEISLPVADSVAASLSEEQKLPENNDDSVEEAYRVAMEEDAEWFQEFIASINEGGIDSARSDGSFNSGDTIKDIMMVDDEAAASDDMNDKSYLQENFKDNSGDARNGDRIITETRDETSVRKDGFETEEKNEATSRQQSKAGRTDLTMNDDKVVDDKGVLLQNPQEEWHEQNDDPDDDNSNYSDYDYPTRRRTPQSSAERRRQRPEGQERSRASATPSEPRRRPSFSEEGPTRRQPPQRRRARQTYPSPDSNNERLKRRRPSNNRDPPPRDDLGKDVDFWPDYQTFRQNLRREAQMRLSIIGPDFKDMIKSESLLRAKLYKEWLGFLETVQDDDGTDDYDDYDYEPTRRRTKRANRNDANERLASGATSNGRRSQTRRRKRVGESDMEQTVRLSREDRIRQKLKMQKMVKELMEQDKQEEENVRQNVELQQQQQPRKRRLNQDQQKRPRRQPRQEQQIQDGRSSETSLRYDNDYEE